MSLEHFIVATAGHVDHGKSALVKALTGTDPDRLPEEKERGITIDLGFAFLELPAPGLDGTLYDIGLVDVPGHEDFVKNMVAGVGSINAALFVVAADDGWMPQSEEHLQILEYLGVTQAVVALTKADLAPDPLPSIIQRIRDQLRESPFAGAPIIATSTLTGDGIGELKQTLARVLASTPPPRQIGKPRLFIDRVFSLPGTGTIVTGTLLGGTFSVGQTVIVQPGGQPTRIRSIQTNHRGREWVRPGTRTALNLTDLSVSDRPSITAGSGVLRGQVVTLPELGSPSDTLDAALEKSSRLINAKTLAARPLRDGTRVRVHHGTTHVPARVLLFDQGELCPGQRLPAQLRLDAPILALQGDHFIVRDWSEQTTLAGGIVLDADAKRRGWRDPGQQQRLRARMNQPFNLENAVTTQLAQDHTSRLSRLLIRSNFSGSEIAEAAANLQSRGDAVLLQDFVVEAAWWNARRQDARDRIDTHHRDHPEQPGLPLTELRALLLSNFAAPELFDLLVADLSRTGFVQVGSAIQRTGHRPALPKALQAAGVRLRTLLAEQPFDPPARPQLAADSTSQQTLRFLIQTGEVVEVGPLLVLSAANYAKARDLIIHHLQARGSASVSELRQALGTSRRVIVPLLEKLDREKLTQREGDLRRLREARK